jgi:hypothetical protein
MTRRNIFKSFVGGILGVSGIDKILPIGEFSISPPLVVGWAKEANMSMARLMSMEIQKEIDREVIEKMISVYENNR